MFELKQVLHRQWDLSLVVHENGFTREALADVRGNKISGRVIKDRYDDCCLMCKHALAHAKEFLDSKGDLPSGTTHEDLLDFVRRKMYVHCKGAVDAKSAKKDSDPVKEDDTPDDYIFTGYFTFALFGPHGLSGSTLSCLAEDDKGVKPASRSQLRKEAAEQKQKERDAGKGGHVPKEYVRGAPLAAKTAVATISQREDIERRQNVRENIMITETEITNGWNRCWTLRSELRNFEGKIELTLDELEELEFLKEEVSELRKQLRKNRKRKNNLYDQADRLMSEPVKRQVTALEEQVGSFQTPQPSTTAVMVSSEGTSNTNVTADEVARLQNNTSNESPLE